MTHTNLKATWFTGILLNFCLCSCSEKNTNGLLLGEWKMVENSSSTESPFDVHRGTSYNFINDSIVDTNNRYFKRLQSGVDRVQSEFLGTTTKYSIVKDSLKFYNPVYSVWESVAKIKRITADTLVLVKNGTKNLIFVKRIYGIDKNSEIDQIALSTSGCFGWCPIIDIIINANGEVIFYGQEYVDKIGFYEAKISKQSFTNLAYNFRRLDLKNLKKQYSVEWTDDKSILTTFSLNDKFVNSIQDYGNAGPDELVWGYAPLRYLYQGLQLKKLDSAVLPYYLNIRSFRFEKGSQICYLAQSESFLLWNYLRTGDIVQAKSDRRFTLRFDQNQKAYSAANDASNSLRKTMDDKKVKSIVTDGRLFTFEISDGKLIIVDIGFNFYDRNSKFFEFREKGEYD